MWFARNSSVFMMPLASVIGGSCAVHVLPERDAGDDDVLHSSPGSRRCGWRDLVVAGCHTPTVLDLVEERLS